MQPELQPNWRALFLYLSYCRRYPRPAVLAGCFSICLALRDTIVPLLVALVLGRYIRSGRVDVNLLIFTALFQLLLIFLSHRTDKWGVSVLHNRVAKDLYEDSFNYLIHQDYAFFANRFSGSLVNQASRFAKAYTVFSDITFFDMLPLLFSVMIAVSVMIHYVPWIGLAILAVWLVAVGLVIYLGLNRCRCAGRLSPKKASRLASWLT